MQNWSQNHGTFFRRRKRRDTATPAAFGKKGNDPTIRKCPFCIITTHTIIKCLNVSNLNVFTLGGRKQKQRKTKKDIFLMILLQFSVHLSQIVPCTKAILCILLN